MACATSGHSLNDTVTDVRLAFYAHRVGIEETLLSHEKARFLATLFGAIIPTALLCGVFLVIDGTVNGAAIAALMIISGLVPSV